MRKLITAVSLTLSVLLAVPLAASPASAKEVPPSTPTQRATAIVQGSIVYTTGQWSAYVKIGHCGLSFSQCSAPYYWPGGYVNGGHPFTWTVSCTGFVVSPDGAIATAGHCVDPGPEGAQHEAVTLAAHWLVDKGYAVTNANVNNIITYGLDNWSVEGQAKGSQADLKETVYFQQSAGGLQVNGGTPATVVAVQPWSKGDAALLRIDKSGLPVLKIANTSDIPAGTQILSVGYPAATAGAEDQTLSPDFLPGTVNSSKTRGNGLLPVFQVSSEISAGMSGGPSVNLQGDVVGINSYGITDNSAQSFNYITPSSVLSQLLAQNGVQNRLGSLDQTLRDGLTAYFSGDAKTAGQDFDTVLGQQPTNLTAQQYKVKANQWLAAHPQSGFPIVLIIAIVVVLAIVIGLVLWLVNRNKRGAAAGPGGPGVQAGYQAPAAPAYQAPAAPAAAPTTPYAAPVAPAAPAYEAPATAQQTAVAPEPPAAPAPSAPVEPATQPISSNGEAAATEGQGSTLVGEQTRFCGNCGAQVPTENRFCQRCGHEMG